MEALALALLFLLVGASSFHGSFAQSSLSDSDIDVLLEDLRSKGFFTGATILSYVASSDLAPTSTLLIPTDKSLVQALSIEPSDYEALIKFHILQTDFDFSQLRLLPVGTWIPTALQGYGVEIINNSASNFSLSNAQIVDHDICPRVAKVGLSCQGISAVLDPSSGSKPTNPPFGSAPPSASAPTPSASPLQIPSLSPSPLASEPSASVSPLQFLSPASSPSISPSPSLPLVEPVPLAVAPSPSTLPPAPSVPIFQAPIPSPPPFFAGAPAPEPSASEAMTSGASSTVTTQISTLAFVMLSGIMVLAVM